MILVVILAPYGGGKVIADGAHVEIEICVGGVSHFLAFRCFAYDESLSWGSDTFDHYGKLSGKSFCDLCHMCAYYVWLDIALETCIVQV